MMRMRLKNIDPYTYTLSYNDFNFAPKKIAFLIHWLHTPRGDGKPRVLILPVVLLDYSAVRSGHKIPHFIVSTIKEVTSNL
jgi:hypothetical protein